ncbi:MAG: hypothetical protein M5R42_04430 [Rhodocyclaceae bacterium]|nr:hypothetical protein [Rhodocyclaceae bacterium]
MIDGEEAVAAAEEIVAERSSSAGWAVALQARDAHQSPEGPAGGAAVRHHATLPRDTVRTMLPDHDVYIADWPTHAWYRWPRAISIFATTGLHAGVHAPARPDVHVISVRQPTVPVLAAISLMAAENDLAQPRSMTLMGGPIDTRRAPTEVNRYAKTRSLRWFDTMSSRASRSAILATCGASIRASCSTPASVAMNSDRHMQAHLDFYNHLVEGDGESAEAHRSFYD